MSNVVEDRTALSPAKVLAPGKQAPTGPAVTYSFAPTDSNEHRTFIGQILDFVGGYVQNFFRSKHHPSPPATASDEISVVSNNGQAAVSEGGGPYVWIKSLDYVHLGDKRFGLNGGGTVYDTTALSTAIQATVAASSSGKKGCLVLPSDVQIRIASAVTVSAAIGFSMFGTGRHSSIIIVDPTTPNDNGLVINASQMATLEGFSIRGKQSNPAGTLLLFDYQPATNLSTGHSLRDLLLYIAQGSQLAFQYGIQFSNLTGENSEVNYDTVTIEGFSEAGIYLPGTQQYGHVMRNVQLNGRWDGVDHTANGGKFGVKTAGGSFQFRDGGVGGCRGAAFFIGAPTAPCVIDGVDMESCYQLLGDGNPSSGISAGSGRQSVVIDSCRFDASAVAFDDTGIIQTNVGPLEVRNNDFYGGDGSTGQTLIAVAPGDIPDVTVENNKFLTGSSKDFDPIAIYGSAVNYRRHIRCHPNQYADSLGSLDHRNEVINVTRQSTVSIKIEEPTRTPDLWGIDLAAQFKANAASQTVDFATAQPKGITYLDFRAHLYHFVELSTGATLTMRVGTTSGGDELMQDTVLGGSGVGDGNAWYGEAPTERGTKLLYSGGHMPNGLGTSHVYVTVTASTGVLGNGTVSNITRGEIHWAAEYKLQPRLIA